MCIYITYRGFRKSYYEEDFIVANEKVDKHLDNVGYTLDVSTQGYII